jgi:virulence-associated protein VagC
MMGMRVIRLLKDFAEEKLNKWVSVEQHGEALIIKPREEGWQPSRKSSR